VDQVVNKYCCQLTFTSKKAMKVNSKIMTLISLVSASLSLTSNSVQAATVSFSDPVPEEGLSYEWTVQLDSDDTAEFSYYVGAKSWNEPANPVGLKGWTHTSNWVALELLEPTQLNIQIDRQPGVPTATDIAGDQLYPAFSLYKGWQNNGEEDHQYNTVGNTDWIDKISYLAHAANENRAISVFESLTLPAGLYSLSIGGNPPEDPSIVGFHGYSATLTTAPVPEPATSGLLFMAIGILGIATRRQSEVQK
jgi:hypothetical protein